MLKYKKEDLIFFKSLWKVFNINIIETFRYICDNSITEDLEVDLHKKVKLGQKLIPLNLLEATHHFNIEYTPWKEFLIANKLSDLVVNNITNGFSLTNSWFLIKSNKKGLYDNPSQADRIEKSNIATKIVDILNQARTYTRQNINTNEQEGDSFNKTMSIIYPSVLSENKKHITSWLSSEFYVLNKKIKSSIDHTKKNIIMSNVSLNIISEYLGKTLYDAVFFTKKSEYYNKLVDHPFSEVSYSYFKKYMFQICYNLYCINSKYGIIHGDLHLNNITLNSLFYKKSIHINVKNPLILYVLSPEYQYIFEHNFYDLCLIDFSRAILHIDTYNLLKLDSIPDFYNIIHSKKQFTEIQITLLLDYLISIKPEYKDLEIQITNQIKHHYNSFFKILTTLDLFHVSNKLLDFIKLGKETNFTSYYPKTITLIENINKSADYYLSIELNNLLEKRNYQEVDEMEWPILTIIKDIFAENLSDNFKTYKNIVDVYNYNSIIQYSISSLKKFPPTLQTNKQYENGKITTQSKNKLNKLNLFKKRRKTYEEQTFKNFKVINIIMKRQYEKNV